MKLDLDPAASPKHAPAAPQAPAADVLTPFDRYQELFVAVQRSEIFSDSKTFVDCAPKGSPADILAAYRAQCDAPGFDLAGFVKAHFRSEQPPRSTYVSIPGQPLAAHIDALWPVLTREPASHPAHASLLPLPHPYVVPGGRFGELYYWDSYFVMIGLACSGRTASLRHMVDNFAYLLDTYGLVPNGTRTYYLSRSQPPMFASMVKLAERHGVASPTEFLPQLLLEHAYWMRGSDSLAPGEARGRVVRLPDGAVLNRYWDDRDTPREESWIEDVSTVHACRRDPAQVYRDLRAACESGWDFSSRWLREPASAGALPHGASQAHARARTAPSLASICTTDIVPVDLNALLFKLETTIAERARRSGDFDTETRFRHLAQARRSALVALCWDETQGAFFDHDWRLGERRRCLTAACVVPLFAGLADPVHAHALERTVKARLLAPGGLSTSECFSDQQWDRPNGWAPLQWMAIRGFADHGCDELARILSTRWLETVGAVYETEGKLVEKYAIRHVQNDRSAGGGGGEYPLQDGFGWTNGVVCALLAMCPEHDAGTCAAHARLHRYR